jgi:filamentous hemagglutinin
LAISNKTAGTTTVIQQSNTFWTSSFGLQLGTNGILILTTNAQLGTTVDNTFDLAAGGQKGTLILSNAANVSAFTLFLVKGTVNTANTNAVVNAGTIQFVTGAGQTAGINYGQTLGFTNLSGGTIVKNGVGTANFTGTFGPQNRGFVNDGTVVINAGVLKFDPRDAFSIGGFSNTVNGKIFIANNATGIVARTINAWANGSVVGNVGSVNLLGGSYLAQATDDSVFRNYTNVNTGVISGFGTLGWSVRNDAGTLAATGGVLNVSGQIIGAAGTFSAGGAGAGNSGTLLLIGGNAGGAAGTLTGNLIVTNGSAVIFTGGSDWTVGGAATVRFANANLTAAQRGSLISSNSGVASTLFLANTAFVQNFGTLLVAGGNGMNFGQIGVDGTDMTNRLFMGGVGTFNGNFGGANQALNNLGTISTVSGGLLTIDPGNANHFGGFQNGLVAGDATGTVVIANNSTLAFRRSDAAWFTGGVSPTNLGTINMQGGTMIASNTDFGTGKLDGGKFVNAASGVMSITGTNNITNFRVLQNNGLLALAASAHLTNTLNSSGSFDNSGGVIQLNGTGSLQGGGANFFTVNGNYINNSSSAITNTAGGGILLFTTVTAVTNNGTISFLSGTGGAGGSGAGGNTNAMIAVGTSAANFFRNSGTLIFGTRSNAASRAFVISNQFLNAGTFVITNGAVLGAGGQPIVVVQGSTRATGGASTNAATGTIRLVNEATLGAATANAGTVTFNNGDFVNLGTLTVSAVTNQTASWTLSEAGAVFSNAATGRVILEPGQISLNSFSIRADNVVNAGTLVLSNSFSTGGTLNIQNSASVSTNLFNSGVILFGGGDLDTKLFTNTATGLIQGNGTISGTSTRLNVNAGTIRASGGTLFMGSVTNSSQVIATPGSSLRLLDLNNGATGVLTADTANVTIVGTTTNSGTMTYLSSVGTLTGAARNEASGMIRANTSTLVFVNPGVFTNLGTVAFINSIGTFSGSVRNDGVWTLNPSTNNISGNLTVAATGTRSLTGSVDIVGANLSVEAGGAYSLSQASSVTAAGISTNAGDLALRQGSVGTFTGAAVNSGSFLANSSTAVFGGALMNTSSGTLAFANNARVIVAGTFTNAGTFTMTTGVGTFNSGVVNSGAWITDPTTNVFQNTYTVTSSGYIQMAGGDVYVFTNGASTAADFVNLSSKSNEYNTANGKFLFDNTLGLTQNLVVAGHDLGPGPSVPPPNATNSVGFGEDATIPGFSNNFALGTLEISDFSTVRVSDAFSGLPGFGTNDGLMAGLYLDNLLMGLDSLLIISSNVQVYFKSSNTWDTSNFVLEGNPTFNNSINGLHQLAVIPEPGVMFLWLCGVATVYASRRRSMKIDRG